MLTQIVPAITPSINGVGDYALGLARTLQKKWGISSNFIVSEQRNDCIKEVEGFPVRFLEEHSPLILYHALKELCCGDVQDGIQSSVILLQMSGYGYERNGYPLWLSRGLKSWKEDNNYWSGILITMFHELYAKGAPWQKAFWVASLQRKILKDIRALTDISMTSNEEYARYLGSDGFGVLNTNAILNIPSNVGEPKNVPDLLDRPPRLAIFGAKESRERVYTHFSHALHNFIRIYKIEEVVDIGASLDVRLPSVLNCIFRSTGVLSAKRVSDELSQCRGGIIAYPVATLGKSSIFGAYCAHGLLPLIAWHEDRNEDSGDNLIEGQHYLHLNHLESSGNWHAISHISKKARNRYSEQNLNTHAEYVANVIHQRTCINKNRLTQSSKSSAILPEQDDQHIS